MIMRIYPFVLRDGNTNRCRANTSPLPSSSKEERKQGYDSNVNRAHARMGIHSFGFKFCVNVNSKLQTERSWWRGY